MVISFNYIRILLFYFQKKNKKISLFTDGYWTDHVTMRRKKNLIELRERISIDM